ncbi:xanthine dehydrogenase/oxidase-like isoform X2 [Dreissena polymorpha]|uniref:FAD-binding PCMH-type domain-containing protein n=1 Tax=Dreissena polymorpha TaxID=45954 RepID=A0A9D4QRX2_DREPO|nr:xanthine dehydrogenase/oxidase-like isoform X2 [Dreissena polymorpha]KAH3841169.1 hypothetical protein DPMN_114627 [Dreissena polymorpha]
MFIAAAHRLCVTAVAHRRLIERHGLQCGFCTPGFVMSAFTLLRNEPRPSRAQLERAIQGNLCRCTGYRPIMDALLTFSDEECPMGDQCCKIRREDDTDLPIPPRTPIADQVPIFPPELQLPNTYGDTQLEFSNGRITWYRPVTMEQLLLLRDRFPRAPVVMGNTTTGRYLRAGKYDDEGVLIYGGDIQELRKSALSADGISVGAGLTVAEFETKIRELDSRIPDAKKAHIRLLYEMFARYAVEQIRNVATVGGSIACGRNDSDFNTTLHAIDVNVVLTSEKGERTVPISKLSIGDGEVIIRVVIPFSDKDEYGAFFKQAERRSFSLAIVNAAMTVRLSDDNRIQRLRVCLGGVAKDSVLHLDLRSVADGRMWDESCLHGVLGALTAALEAENGHPKDAYKVAVASACWFKFFVSVRKQRQLIDASSYEDLVRPVFQGPFYSSQTYDSPADADQSVTDAVGRTVNVTHADSAVSGRAIYVDDIPEEKDELFVGLVLSKRAHARIVHVNPARALAFEGVTGYIDHSDIPGRDGYGSIVPDQLVFAKDEVLYSGQPISGVIATSREIALRAADMVEVQYEDLPAILTIEDAIAVGSYIGDAIKMCEGDVEAALTSASYTFEGEYGTGLQDHFYMEPQASVARVREDNEVEVCVTTQNIATVQGALANLLGVTSNKVTVKVKRLGGSFGGKDVIPVASAGPAAIAAKKTGRTVRCVLPREVDMAVRGKRHPFLGRYKVGVSMDGVLEAVDLRLYSNGGYAMDLSLLIMELAVIACESGYKVRNLRVEGRVCRTNTSSNTAMRGFGHPQSALIMEDIVARAAAVTGFTPEQMRERNLYKSGDVTPYGTLMEKVTLTSLWAECKRKSEFERRLKEVESFNANNRWKKRGLSMTASKYGVGFSAVFLNQGAALVNIYMDGSVLVAHGGIEMGQGLHTKLIQIASRVLGVPREKIFTNETSSREIPNATVTAGSMGTDTYGPAVRIACETLVERLKPLREQMQGAPWEKLIIAAFFQRIQLSATGFWKSPMTENFHAETKSGRPHNFYTYGTACTEVEIDVLTGESQVVRADLFVDIGRSLNPAVDIGQIEGAFVQGLGMVTSEDMWVDENGDIINNTPLKYKIPNVSSIPRTLNVTLMKNFDVDTHVYSSKSAGEPPLILAMSVISAIKHAIASAREQRGETGYFRLDSPATVQRIQTACGRQIIK